jgi:hypothetical protein
LPAASESMTRLCCSTALTINFRKKRMKLPTPEIWFVTGSQHLYGPGPLKQVAANSQQVVDGLNGSKRMALPLVFKSLVTRPDEIRQVCQQAGKLRGPHPLDAYVLSIEDVDRRIEGSPQAVLASAHAI